MTQSSFIDNESCLIVSLGHKDYAPDGSVFQQNKIDSLNASRYDIISKEREVAECSLIKGVWHPSLHRVEVIQEKGKFLPRMGYHEARKKYLFPEEALFLLDQGLMELSYGGVGLTLQDAHYSLLSFDNIFEHYLVYAHLSRLGFIIQRHNCDSKHNLMNASLKRTKKALKRQVAKQDENNRKRKVKKIQSKWNSCDTDNQSRVTTQYNFISHLNEKDLNCKNNDCEMPLDNLSDMNDINANNLHSSVKYSNWNFDEIHIPCVFNRNSNQKVKNIDYNSIPSGLRAVDLNIEFDYNNLIFTRMEKDEILYYSHNVNNFNADSSFSNWGQYKSFFRCHSFNLNILPTSHYWKDSVSPLVEPGNATNYESLLNKLQVVKSWNEKNHCRANSQQSKKITYDVYLPKNFKKSMEIVPSYRICVIRIDDEVIDPSNLIATYGVCDDNVTLLFAIVDCGEIMFYTLNDIILPTDYPLL